MGFQRRRTNCNAMPRWRNASTRGFFRKSGRPIWLRYRTAQTSARRNKSTAMRHSRKRMRHLIQNRVWSPMGENVRLNRDEVQSSNTRRDGKIAHDQLIKCGRKDKDPSFAVECHGGQGGLARERCAEIYRMGLAVFECGCDRKIARF